MADPKRLASCREFLGHVTRAVIRQDSFDGDSELGKVVGERILIAWSWNDPSSESARLRAPATVLRVDADSVAVDFDPRMPNRSIYAAAWTYSGHIRANPDGSFAVDPCSATFERGGW